jgi:peptidoglycan hydrolase-like protein with peptidoglycan-binding domain
MEKKHLFLAAGVAAIGAAFLFTRSAKAAPAVRPLPTPTPPPKPAVAAPTGSNGGASIGQIKCIQQKLNEGGFNAGSVDGQYGPQTTAAVMAFQRKKGIAATGNLDTPTLATELGACLVASYALAPSAQGGPTLPGLGAVASACDIAGHMIDDNEADRVLAWIANLTDYEIAKKAAVALANAAPPCYDLASRAMAKADELYVLANAAV